MTSTLSNCVCGNVTTFLDEFLVCLTYMCIRDVCMYRECLSIEYWMVMKPSNCCYEEKVRFVITLEKLCFALNECVEDASQCCI